MISCLKFSSLIPTFQTRSVAIHRSREAAVFAGCGWIKQDVILRIPWLSSPLIYFFLTTIVSPRLTGENVVQIMDKT